MGDLILKNSIIQDGDGSISAATGYHLFHVKSRYAIHIQNVTFKDLQSGHLASFSDYECSTALTSPQIITLDTVTIQNSNI